MAALAEANITGQSQRLYPRREPSVSAARRELRGALAEWGVSNLGDSAELVLSELITNAIRHASPGNTSQVLVALHLNEARLRVSVSDGDRFRLPRKANDWTTGEGGRGLLLVEALSLRWGVEPRDPGVGKTVWAEMARVDGEEV